MQGCDSPAFKLFYLYTYIGNMILIREDLY